MTIINNSANLAYINVNQAIEKLNNGELVAIPTETVYGLAANINIGGAIDNIYKLKGRPNNHPLIVHVHQNFDVEKYAKVNYIAQKLIDNFWPAPLTLVLPKTKYISEYITGGQNTVAIRSPNHILTQEVLGELNCGVAAPSANKFGYISPTKAIHVYNEYINHDMKDIKLSILDGGDCEIGLESTIVYINGDNTITILRHGMLSINELSALVEVKEKPEVKISKIENTPRVSGELLSHYAPKTNMSILTQQQLINFNTVSIGTESFILCFSDTFHQIKLNCENMRDEYITEYIKMLSSNPNEYAHDLYDTLRNADNICQSKKISKIYIEQIPDNIEWIAIQDRLNKASHK